MHVKMIMPTINELLHAHETLRKHANEREFPAQVVSVFLIIAAKDGELNQKAIGKEIGMSASSVSRNVSWLGPRNNLKRRSGLGWIETFKDDNSADHREKKWRLNFLGRQIIKEMLEEQLPPPKYTPKPDNRTHDMREAFLRL